MDVLKSEGDRNRVRSNGTESAKICDLGSMVYPEVRISLDSSPITKVAFVNGLASPMLRDQKSLQRQECTLFEIRTGRSVGGL